MLFYCRYVCLVVILFLACGQMYSQAYQAMMNDDRYTLREVIESAEDYFSDKPKGKGTGYGPYLRWKHEMELIYDLDQDRSEISLWEAVDSYEAFIKKYPYRPVANAQRKSRANWVELGPGDAENVTRHYSPGIGRVEDIYMDENDEDILYLGSRSGGVWQSTDGGMSWTTGTDFLPSSGCNTLAVDPNDNQTVYANIRNALNGHTQGIYKTTNGGNSWSVTSYNRDNQGLNVQVRKIRNHPTRSDLVFAATSNQGLIRSSDGMATWSSVLGQNNIYEIIFHPTDPDTMYVYQRNNNGIYRSFDGGLNWTFKAQNANNGARGFIDVSDAAPDNVYFISSNGVWKSENLGDSWTQTGTITNGINEVAVSDEDPDILMWGNIDMFRSLDGGQTQEQISFWSFGSTGGYTSEYVHADLRQIISQGDKFIIGTDGYYCVSDDDGINWTRLNIGGTGIRENYTMGLAQSHHLYDAIGSQDNGTSIRNNGTWLEWLGADGMEAIIHPLDENLILGSQQYAGRHKTTDGGYNQSGANGIPSGYWIAPMSYDPNNQMHVYDGRESIYKSETFGGNWTEVGDPGFGRDIQFMEVAYNDSKIIYASAGNQIKKSTNGGQSWSDISSGLPSNGILGIGVDPHNDDYVVVVYNTYTPTSAKVYISTNGGSSWTNSRFNMTIPVRSVEVGPDGYVYLGCEVGVYYMPIGGNSWSTYNPGLPTMSVRDLEIHWGTNTIRAATWGRGMWEFDLVGRGKYPKINTVDISEELSDQSPNELHDVSVEADLSDQNGFTSSFTITSAEMHYSVNSPDMDLVIPMSIGGSGKYITNNPIPNADVSAGDIVTFKVVATDNNGQTTETHKFTYEVKAAAYCDSEGSDGTGSDWINSVNLQQINNPSAQSTYSDFTSLTTELRRGENYILNFSLNFSFAPDVPYAWIDWDNDFIFEDDERIAMSPYDGSHETIGEFNVPMDADLGNLRLRVRNTYNSDDSPCGSKFGEVEDYTVIILQQLLPVELLSFDATRLENGAVNLRWETAQEINLSHFIIERSLDGVSAWSAVGQKNAQNIAGTHSYSIDDISTQLYQDYYYRLKSVDTDGSFEYSEIRTVKGLSTMNMIAYPNPARDNVVIQLPSSLSNSYRLITNHGQIVRSGKIKDQSQVSLNLIGLEPGSYLFQFMHNESWWGIPIVLQ